MRTPTVTLPRIVTVALLAVALAIGATIPVQATPDTPDVPSAVEVADVAKAPEPAAAPGHAVDWNDAVAICTWLMAIWFPGSWQRWSYSNQSPFNDPVAQCIDYRVTSSGVQFVCIWYRRLHPHETIRIHPPDPCVDLVSFAFP